MTLALLALVGTHAGWAQGPMSQGSTRASAMGTIRGKKARSTDRSALVPKPNEATVTVSVEEIREDFQYLYRTLEAAHYNVYAHTETAVFDREYRRLYSSVRRPLTYLETHRLFQQFAALSRIGHCRLDFPYRQYDDYSRRSGTVFPFDVALSKDHRVVIVRSYSANRDVSAGDQLLSLNGEPIKAVLRDLYKYSSGERRYMNDAALEMISFPRKLWYTRGQADSYLIEVRRPNGRTARTVVAAVPASRFNEARKDLEVFDLKREFRFIDGVLSKNSDRAQSAGDGRSLGYTSVIS